MLLRIGDPHKGCLCVYMYYKARDKHLCICIWFESQSQTLPKEMWEFAGAVGGVVAAAGAGHIPARGAGGFWRLGKTEQPSMVYSLSQAKALKCSFFMVPEDFLVGNLLEVGLVGFTCAPVNWEITRNLWMVLSISKASLRPYSPSMLQMPEMWMEQWSEKKELELLLILQN